MFFVILKETIKCWFKKAGKEFGKRFRKLIIIKKDFKPLALICEYLHSYLADSLPLFGFGPTRFNNYV